jgi:mRNA-degrading endonuclease toxin of MazEF toxin-antitoxin module
MGHYSRGDVVIASVGIDGKSGVKTRPVVVIRRGKDNDLFLCPISSRPAADAPSIPVSLDDFSYGGLDLFGESYVLVSRVVRIHCSEIIGKKGHLAEDTITAIISHIPQSHRSGTGGTKNTRPGPGK